VREWEAGSSEQRTANRDRDDKVLAFILAIALVFLILILDLSCCAG
jgi:hypothetical protein